MLALLTGDSLHVTCELWEIFAFLNFLNVGICATIRTRREILCACMRDLVVVVICILGYVLFLSHSSSN